ncbi:hypothetical protein N431DRAFT_489969 [Stipitochalara longipes BDJ]|nr:hypothetical protein N431DRAFT_489969 [Stipitochalara longipes BDJ]
MSITKYAVLVGVDSYPHAPSLFGCVQDVEDVSSYLRTSHSPVIETRFTAPVPHHPPALTPSGDSTSKPTYKNFVSRLEEITKSAKQGDFVYIHFSGHGVRRSAKTPGYQYQDSESPDVALVFLDEERGERYLYGIELACLLDLMVAKGLVMVVLDCCYAGGVKRHDDRQSGIRGTDWNDDICSAYPVVNSLHKRPPHDDVDRDADWQWNWLLAPKNYTLIAACAPHELAHESTLNGKCRGVLTYHLLSALSLRKNYEPTVHRSLHLQVLSSMRVRWPNQTPILLGNRSAIFLGGETNSSVIDHLGIWRKQGKLFISAGAAQGVCVGDLYAVYPFDALQTQALVDSASIIKVQVVLVDGLESQVFQVGGQSMNADIKEGWRAEPLTRFSVQKTTVALDQVADGHIRDQIRHEVTQRHTLQLSDMNSKIEAPMYHIRNNERNELEILGASLDALETLPALQTSQDNAFKDIADMMDHVARFKFIESIQNRLSPPFLEKGFTIHFEDENKNVMEEGALTIPDGGIFKFVFTNTSYMPLYLSIYNLTPLWQVKGLLQTGGAGYYRIVEPKKSAAEESGKKTLTIGMEIPHFLANKGIRETVDVLKIFVTARPVVSFHTLELPKLRQYLAPGEQLPEVPRGQQNRLEDLATGKCMKIKDEDNVKERATEIMDIENAWISRNLVIRTVAV